MRKIMNVAMRAIMCAGVLMSLLMLGGCEDLKYVREDGYVLYWRKAAPEVVYKRPDNLSTFTPAIKILFWGKEPEYTATYARSRATYEQLCAKWGDTDFRGTRKILADHPAYEYTATDLGFRAIDVSISKDVSRGGVTYPAGMSLAEVAQLTFTTLRRYIANGYKTLPDADYSAILEIDDRMTLYGYERVSKLFTEITPEDMNLVGPYAMITWLSKTSVPLSYDITVTLTDENGKVYECTTHVDPYNLQ